MKKQLTKLWKWIDGGTTGDRKFNVFMLSILIPLVLTITYQIVLN